MSTPHDNPHAKGEKCRVCRKPAHHKVAEEVPQDIAAEHPRHEFTAYVCCLCFGDIFGIVAHRFCQLYNSRPPVMRAEPPVRT